MKFFPRGLIALLCFGGLVAGNQSFAKEPSNKTRELKFKPGSKTIIRKDGLENGGVGEYRLTGQAGQMVVIRISSRPFGSVVPVEGAIQSPNGEILPLSFDVIERWSVTLSTTGPHVLRVSPKSPSRRKATYILTVTLKSDGPLHP
jgi:hypothetical protein